MAIFTEMGNFVDGKEFQKYCFRHINFEMLTRHIIAEFWAKVMARVKHLVVIIYRRHGNGCHP